MDKLFQAAHVTKKPDGSRSVDTKERTVEGWASKPIIDRDNELIESDAWELDNFNSNPVLMPFHDYSKNPVGRVLWTKATDEGLLFKAKFADEGTSELADEMFALYDQGIMNAFSVGFKPMQWVDAKAEGDPKRRYTQAELLEISGVGLPSCTGALVNALEDGSIRTASLQDQIRADAITKGLISVPKAVADNDAATASDGMIEKSLDRAFPEDDPIWDDVIEKEGRTLSKKTLTAVTTAHTALGDLLAANAVETDDTDADKTTTKADGMWNRTLSKSFDIAQYDEANTIFRYGLFTKFLDCQVKNIYVNSHHIPSPLLGTYLEAISVVTADIEIDDTRRFSYEGKESPPSRSYIQLNSKRRKRFLVDGSEYAHDNDMALIKDFSPGWSGMQFSIVTSNTDEVRNDEIMHAIHTEADANHMLKGEKFALSGEFLSETDDTWDELIINNKDKQAIQKSLAITSKDNGNSRGLLLVGPPGTGKTKAGRTIMNDTENTFIWVSARDFMYGWPDRILALSFDMARKLAPSVLFMEDVDQSLNKDMLKTELDGLKQNKGLMTVLTTNHPDRLPKALIDRPGRFHHVILFDVPDEDQRKQMFKLWAGEIETKILDVLIESTDGFSGAHIHHLVEYSKTIAEDEEMSIGKALIESLIRMSEQIELVAELQSMATKGMADVEAKDEASELLLDDVQELDATSLEEMEITPAMAAQLLLQDDMERKAAEAKKKLTPDEELLVATGVYV